MKLIYAPRQQKKPLSSRGAAGREGGREGRAAAQHHRNSREASRAGGSGADRGAGSSGAGGRALAEPRRRPAACRGQRPGRGRQRLPQRRRRDRAETGGSGRDGSRLPGGSRRAAPSPRHAAAPGAGRAGQGGARPGQGEPGQTTSPVRNGCASWHTQGRSEKRLPEPPPTLCLSKLLGNAVADRVTRANKPSHRISPDVVSGNGEHKQTVVPSPAFSAWWRRGHSRRCPGRCASPHSWNSPLTGRNHRFLLKALSVSN